MSSSDSDDDCYGNAAKRLQSLKKTYVSEKFDDVCVGTQPQSDVLSKNLVSSSIVLDDSNASLNLSNADDEELTLETIIANNTKPKRGRKRKVVDGTFEPVSERVTRSRRKITSKTTNESRVAINESSVAINESSVAINENPSTSNCSEIPNKSVRGRKKTTANLDTTSRGRGRNNRSPRVTRGRARRGRGSRNSYLWLNPSQITSYPIYSIGDFGEYPDMCNNQELFSSKSNEVEIVEENDPLENDNEELSVKVYWQSTKVFRFKIRRYQKLTPIFKHFAEKENINVCKLLLMYRDKIIKADDTPDSINYNIAEFIEGGIVNSDVTRLVKENNTDLSSRELSDGFRIKFQCQILKKPFEMTVKQEDRLATAMTLCAEHLELPIEKLKFYFDGDLISNKKTPQELGLENGDCIDVKIIS